MPDSGWRAGLFGRRDALILTLVCRLGLPVARVGELRCGDVTVDVAVGVLYVAGGHHITISLEADNPHGVYSVLPLLAVGTGSEHHTRPGHRSGGVLARALRPRRCVAADLRPVGNPTAPIGDTTTGMNSRAVDTFLHTYLRARPDGR
ncbi:hypothetical protein [Gordonia terrae]|uniref:hypothetical protein n=1 Tax=Gordonia terrae TaxID=2055 RepID=UPI003F6C577B